MAVSSNPANLLCRYVVGWRSANPTYRSRHCELKIAMAAETADLTASKSLRRYGGPENRLRLRLARSGIGDRLILLKIPAIKRGFLALTRRVK
ncbi:hypothetical protein TMSI_16950 [Klebsiella quasipneumoniae]|nr:hypothetical protein [Klebsiella quasipneumoniae]MBM5560761.1 hypothetical protein [Klebsiella quasipneumoniae]QSI11870.1 hypothetical protein FA956_08705 [Klebsiella quasipneumoniae]BBK11303.1 hypothetical protein TMSI_16950 [Klebsiella quasipneumoniae]